MSLSKKDIVNNILSKAHISSKNSHKFLDHFLDIIKKRSKNNVIKISNFGTFSSHTSPERLGRNPKTKMEFIIPKQIKIKFQSSTKIKNTFNSL